MDFNEVDLAYELPGEGRFRVNISRQRRFYNIVLRVIPLEIRTFEELNLPSVLRDLAQLRRGYVLVTGATGMGKSTTLATMIARGEPRRGRQDRHDRGSDRVRVHARQEHHHAARGRTDTRSFPARAARRAAPGPRRDHGRRDARPRDRRHLAQGGRDRPPGVLVDPHRRRRARRSAGSSRSSRPRSSSRCARASRTTCSAVVSLRLLPNKKGTARVPAVEVMRDARAAIQECIKRSRARRTRSPTTSRARRTERHADLRPAPARPAAREQDLGRDGASAAASNPTDFQTKLALEGDVARRALAATRRARRASTRTSGSRSRRGRSWRSTRSADDPAHGAAQRGARAPGRGAARASRSCSRRRRRLAPSRGALRRGFACAKDAQPAGGALRRLHRPGRARPSGRCATDAPQAPARSGRARRAASAASRCGTRAQRARARDRCGSPAVRGRAVLRPRTSSRSLTRFDHARARARVAGARATRTAPTEPSQSDEVLQALRGAVRAGHRAAAQQREARQDRAAQERLHREDARELRTPLNSIIEAIISVLAGENEDALGAAQDGAARRARRRQRVPAHAPEHPRPLAHQAGRAAAWRSRT